MRQKKETFVPQIYIMILLSSIVFGLFDPNSAYADPNLPIVAGQEVISIEVYPVQHQLIVRMQGQKNKRVFHCRWQSIHSDPCW